MFGKHQNEGPLRRRLSGGAAIALAMTTLLGIGPLAADAATVSGAWRARVGNAGVNGTATLQAYTTGTGSIVLKLARLKASTLMPVTLYKGTCSSVGAVLARFPAIKTTSSGAAARTSSLTAAQVNSIRAATRATGKIAIRVGSGSTIKCGLFTALAVGPPPPAVAARIPVGSLPQGVVVTPNGVWVTNWLDGTLSRIDPTTNTVLANVPLTLTGIAGPQAITYGEGSLWVTIDAYDATGLATTAGSVVRIEPTTGQVIATIPVGRRPLDIAMSPGAVWVVNYEDGTVSRIDPTTNQVSGSVTLAAGVIAIAYGSGAVWATNEQTGTVSRIDPATNQVVATIATVGSPEGVAVGAGSVWVSNWGTTGTADGVISRIDPTTNQVVKTIPVGANPGFCAFGGGRIWIAMQGETTVVAVDATTNAVTSRTQIGTKGWGIAATDHAAWVVQPVMTPDANYQVPPGTVTRLNY